MFIFAFVISAECEQQIRPLRKINRCIIFPSKYILFSFNSELNATKPVILHRQGIISDDNVYCTVPHN